MKAAQINKYGDSSVIEIVDIDKPAVTAGKVLIEVHSSSLNPIDTIVRAGYMHDMMPITFPATLGGDVAGVVTEVGEDVTSVAVGDKVYGQAMILAGNSGALAEFAVTSEQQIAHMPESLSFEEAAALPLTAVSALQALHDHIGLQSGQKLFIHGGAGGIGLIAIQIAKNAGAYVATTATGDGIEAVKQLGADEVIDYKNEDFTTVLKDFDAVLNLVGNDEFTKTLHTLKKGGIGVSLAGDADDAVVEELGVTAISQFTKTTTEKLNQLTQLVESGVVKPQIDSEFSLDQIKEAFDYRENNQVKGKVVIKIVG
jgi:NADPH:quinone reductase-like Zn-dependent oxidoreductase